MLIICICPMLAVSASWKLVPVEAVSMINCDPFKWLIIKLSFGSDYMRGVR